MMSRDGPTIHVKDDTVELFFETRFQKSCSLWFAVTLDTLKDLKVLSIIMHFEIMVDFDVFIGSLCFIFKRDWIKRLVKLGSFKA